MWNSATPYRHRILDGIQANTVAPTLVATCSVKHGLEALTVEDVVTEDEGNRLVADEFSRPIRKACIARQG